VNLHDNYNKVLSIDPLSKPEYGVLGAPPVTAYATVQAGIRLKDLCAQLEAKGYGVHNMGVLHDLPMTHHEMHFPSTPDLCSRESHHNTC
jgi:hypothetical protein